MTCSISIIIKLLREVHHFCKGQSNKESLYYSINATERKQEGNCDMKFLFLVYTKMAFHESINLHVHDLNRGNFSKTKRQHFKKQKRAFMEV